MLEEIEAHTGPKEVREYLIEGPAGSSKSRTICEVLWYLSHRYPGTRWLILRKTFRSLAESFKQTFEDETVPPGDSCLRGPNRIQRTNYSIEVDGWDGPPTEFVLAGLDEPYNLFSTNFDGLYVMQAEQIDLQTWIRLGTRMRNFSHPELRIAPMIADVNPVEPTHWLNTRANKGLMTRLISRHTDNPRWFPNGPKAPPSEEGRAFIDSLLRMPEGPDKERLCFGRWHARGGLVWDNYRSNVHEIERPANVVEAFKLKWFAGSMDWGYEHAGVLQIWGVDEANRRYRVAEWYRTRKGPDWWADKLVGAYHEFQPLRGVPADPSRPDMIDHMNERLGLIRGERMPHLVFGADNKKTRTGQGDMSGLALVRTGLANQADGKPAIYFVKGSLRERDEVLVEAGVPYCTEMEIPQYVREMDDAGNPVGENTDPDCVQDGCDATRYANTYVWAKDLSEAEIAPRFKAGSLGDILGHEAVMRGERRRILEKRGR